MSVVVKRPPRASSPDVDEDRVELAEPPLLGEPAQADLSSALMMLPMGLGGGAMVLMFAIGGSGGSGTIYMFGGVMGTSVIVMALSQVGRAGRERTRKMRSERRDYLRYLSQERERARSSALAQRRSVEWDHPDPGRLIAVVGGTRVWERRISHDDFARVRIGRGAARARLHFVPPATKPVEDLEPLTAVSLRRFARAHRSVPDVPVTLGLTRLTSVELAGAPGPALALTRAILAQLVVWHSPADLRVAVLTDEVGRQEWDWVKWLPHAAHPELRDAAGQVPMVCDDHDVLMDLLGAGVGDRGDHDPAARPTPGEPFVVVVAHRVTVPATSRLLGAGLHGVVLLDATGSLPGGPSVVRLEVDEDGDDGSARLHYPADPGPAEATADRLSRPGAEDLARRLAPLRAGGTVETREDPTAGDLELTTLLGIRDPRGFDVRGQWAARRDQRARLTVPIGVTEEGEVIELDLKESAQGGMGPHGMLIGATGSGKSELLRTLVVALAATHASDVLNMVLVDFKGGATFLGMDRLPHTSATITNLADELPLVDRMQDSINGELVRRQELLRAHGYASLYDYEKARLGGESLAPLPTLLVVVDEFSELLAAKPEFMDLFVQIGRVGRSLGVHLLLASQRLDEGRIHRVEGHLSYRIALRTFSAMESRSVIGVPSAYELPSAPGNGYLKIDTASLARFKAAYVSGPCPTPDPGTAAAGPDGADGRPGGADGAVTPFVVDPAAVRVLTAAAREPVPVEPVPEPTAEPVRAARGASLLEALVERLQGSGPDARRVWLPPLEASPTLDELLPTVVPDPERGLSAVGYAGGLRVPVGVVDRPAEGRRELLVADLAAGGGHVGIVGGPQSGKSTLLRSLMLSLALTHTPVELQFYCLDLAGGGLAPVAGLPHVGSLAGRLDRDRVQRTVAECTGLLEQRERAFASLGVDSMAGYRAAAAPEAAGGPSAGLDRHGDVVVVVDGWATLRSEFPELETPLTELATRGPAFGLHVVVVTGRWSEIRPAMRGLLSTRLELRLGDPVESEVGARVAATVPAQPGRGLTVDKQHFLAALPRADASAGSGDLSAATRTAVEEIATFWSGPTAPPVRLLPAALPVASLPAPDGDLRMCLGVDEARLAPVWHDFAVTPHLSVFGDGETGKSNLLRLAARAIVARYGPAQARILIADPGRRLHEDVPEPYRIGYAVTAEVLTDLAANAAVTMTGRLPGDDVSPEALARRGRPEGPRVFVLIDDYDLFTSGASGSPAQPLVPLLAHGAYVGLHVVVARSSSSAVRGMMDPLLRRMWELGNPGLVLSYPKEEGKFLGEAAPRTLPPGRAQLATRRGVRLLQTGLVDP